MYTVLHEPPEKRVQMALFAADLPHTANVNAVNISDLDLLHHFAVAGAQQPAAVFIGAAAHNVAAITQRLHRADFEAVHRAVIVSGDTRIYPRAGLFLFVHCSPFLIKT